MQLVFLLRNTLEQCRPKTVSATFLHSGFPALPFLPSPPFFPTPPPRRWPPRAMTCAGEQAQKPGTTRRKKPNNLGFVKANPQKRRKLFAISLLPPPRKTCLVTLKGCNSFFLRNTLEQGRPKTFFETFSHSGCPALPSLPSPPFFPTPPPRRWPPRAMTCAGEQTQKSGTTRREKPNNLGFATANSQKRRNVKGFEKTVLREQTRHLLRSRLRARVY